MRGAWAGRTALPPRVCPVVRADRMDTCPCVLLPLSKRVRECLCFVATRACACVLTGYSKGGSAMLSVRLHKV